MNNLATIETEGLELTVVETAKGKYIPFLQHIADIAEQSRTINFTNPSGSDQDLARELRLKLVPNRTGADRFKKEQKEQFTLVTKLHDACYNIINAESKILENQLEAVEKFTERQEQARLENLKAERTKQLAPYIDFIMPNLELMADEQFKTLLDGQILSYQKKIDDQKAAQELAQKTDQYNRRKTELSRFEVYGFVSGLTIESSQDEYLNECGLASVAKKTFEDKQAGLERENAILRIADTRRARLEAIGMVFANEKFSYTKFVGAVVEFDFSVIKEMADNEFDLTVQFCEQEIAQSRKDKLDKFTKILLANGFVRHNIDTFKKGHCFLLVDLIVEASEVEINAEVSRIDSLIEIQKAESEKADKLAMEKKLAKSSDKVKITHALSGLKLIAPDLKSDEAKATWNVIQQKFDGFINWANKL